MREPFIKTGPYPESPSPTKVVFVAPTSSVQRLSPVPFRAITCQSPFAPACRMAKSENVACAVQGDLMQSLFAPACRMAISKNGAGAVQGD